jgi:thiol-disulfide isomerase/thioredoxin
MRRLTIIVTIAIIAASLAIGIYLVSSVGASGIDMKDNVAVSATDMTTIHQLSLQPYGPANGSGLAKVYSYTGTPFASSGKPIVVYIGAEYCQYCAVSRWGLILALERFGNLSGLEFMTSSADEFDLPTFTFVHAHYVSQYLVFQAYEEEDRSRNTLSVPPNNYSTIWSSVNGRSFPFVDFNNKYVLKGSLIGNPTTIQNRNWTRIFNEISTGDAVGQEIKESANMITSVICKITGGAPGGVCSASPINTITSALAGPFGQSIAVAWPNHFTTFVGAAPRNQAAQRAR